MGVLKGSPRHCKASAKRLLLGRDGAGGRLSARVGVRFRQPTQSSVLGRGFRVILSARLEFAGPTRLH